MAENNDESEPPSATNADDLNLNSPADARGRNEVVFHDEQKNGAKSSVASDAGLLRGPETARAITPGGSVDRMESETN